MEDRRMRAPNQEDLARWVRVSNLMYDLVRLKQQAQHEIFEALMSGPHDLETEAIAAFYMHYLGQIFHPGRPIESHWAGTDKAGRQYESLHWSQAVFGHWVGIVHPPDASERFLAKYEPRSPWERDDLQFPRLLAEIMATCDQLDIEALARSMDLSVERVEELFERAQVAWERIKEKT